MAGPSDGSSERIQQCGSEASRAGVEGAGHD